MKNASQSYAQILKQLSNAILSLQSPTSQNTKKKQHTLQDILCLSSLENMRCYQRNIFGLVYTNLQQDFPALQNYSGENNFRYLAKTLIAQRWIVSSNIFDLPQRLIAMIIDMQDSLQDTTLEYLAKLDDLFMHPQKHQDTQLKLPKGMCSYWQKLYDKESVDNIFIDISQHEWAYILRQQDKTQLICSSSPHKKQPQT